MALREGGALGAKHYFGNLWKIKLIKTTSESVRSTQNCSIFKKNSTNLDLPHTLFSKNQLTATLGLILF